MFAAGLVAVASVCGADDASRRTYDLPAADATETLRQFVEQSGAQVVFFADTVRGITTNPVKGKLPAFDALALMLRGTVLNVTRDEGTGAFFVRERASGPAARRSRPEATGSASQVARGDGFAEETIRLPSFNVSGEPANNYRPADTTSAARIRGQLIDTPHSINVVTRELLRDLGANSVYEATRYFAGISNGRGTGAGGIMDRQNFRGFESFTKTIDNFSGQLLPGVSGFVAVFDPQFIERVEVVMGPDTILSPTGCPGGSMNIITKSPQFSPSNELMLELGNFQAGKIGFDSTGPLGESGGPWAYRVIANHQDAKTFVPGGIKIWDGSAQLTYKFSPASQVTLKYFGTHWQLLGAQANANDNGWLVIDPSTIDGATIADTPPAATGFTYDGWNGNARWSRTSDRVNIVSGLFTTALAENVSMRLGAQVLYDNNVGDSAYPSVSPASIYDPATGRVIGITTIDPKNLPTVARFNHGLSRQIHAQNDFAANLDVRGITLRPIAGWALQQGRVAVTTRQNGNLPPANVFLGDYDPPKPDLLADYMLAAKTRSEARQSQLYALMKAGFFDDHLFLTGGASRTWVSSESRALDVTNPAAAPTLLSLSGHQDTYLGGIVVKPVSNVAIYYTYSSNAALTSASNRPLWQQGRQHEFGAKAELFRQRLALTAAHFQIAQTNLVTPNPAFNVDPAHNPSSILTDNANRGVEFNLVGGLTRDLSIIASYTRMKLRDAFGRRPRNAPDTLANLLLNHRFSEGRLANLAVFGGVVHVGKVAGENPPGSATPLAVPKQVGFYVASWTVFNAGASYGWSRYRLNLNIDNVLDSKFVWQPASRISVSPYPGRTVRLTSTVRF